MGRTLTTSELFGNTKKTGVSTAELFGKKTGLTTAELFNDTPQETKPSFYNDVVKKSAKEIVGPTKEYAKSLIKKPWQTVGGTLEAGASMAGELVTFPFVAGANIAGGLPKKDATGDTEPNFMRDVVGKTFSDAVPQPRLEEGKRIKKVLESPFEALEERGLKPLISHFQKNPGVPRRLKYLLTGDPNIAPEEIEWMVRAGVEAPMIGMFLKGGIKGRPTAEQTKMLRSEMEQHLSPKIDKTKTTPDIAPNTAMEMMRKTEQPDSVRGLTAESGKSVEGSAGVFIDNIRRNQEQVSPDIIKQRFIENTPKDALPPNITENRFTVKPEQKRVLRGKNFDQEAFIQQPTPRTTILERDIEINRQPNELGTQPYFFKRPSEMSGVFEKRLPVNEKIAESIQDPYRVGETIYRDNLPADTPTPNVRTRYSSRNIGPTEGVRNNPLVNKTGNLNEHVRSVLEKKSGMQPKSGSFLQDLNDMIGGERGSFSNKDLSQNTLMARQRVAERIELKLNEFKGNVNKVKEYLRGEGATARQVETALKFYRDGLKKGIYKAHEQEQRKSIPKELHDIGKSEKVKVVDKPLTRTEELRQKFNSRRKDTLPKDKPPKVVSKLRRLIHKVAKEKGMDDATLTSLKKEYGGQDRLTGDNPMGIKQLQSVLKAVRSHNSEQFKKPGTRWFGMKPKWKTARDTGVEPAFKNTGLTKASDVEAPQRTYDAKVDTDKMFKKLNKISKTHLKERVRKKFKNKETTIESKMAEIINENQYAPDTFKDGTPLTKEQKQWFNEYRELTDRTIAETNKVRIEAGMEPIKSKKAYLKHELVPTILDEILEGRYEMFPDLQKQIENTINSKVYAPHELKRKLGDDLGEYFSRNLHELTHAMRYNNIREQVLTVPSKKAAEWLKSHDMPKETRAWAKQYHELLLGKDHPWDKAVQDSWSRSYIRKFLNVAGSPLGIKFGERTIQKASKAVGTEMIRGTMWGVNPKMWIRNKMQVMQGLAFHGFKSWVKSYGPTPKHHKQIIEQSDFLNNYTGIEQGAVKGLFEAFERAGYKGYQWSAKGNANRTFKAMLHECDKLYDNFSEFKHLDGRGGKTWFDPQRTESTPKGYRFPSELKAMAEEAETAGLHAQYGYLPSQMPEVFSIKFLAAPTRLTSWWMNYFSNFMPEMLNRTLVGKSSTGRNLPKSMRLGSFRYLLFGGAVLKTLGYGKSYLTGVIPEGFNPAVNTATGMAQYIMADSESGRKRAWNKITGSGLANIRGGNQARLLKNALDGEWEKVFLYYDQRKQFGYE